MGYYLQAQIASTPVTANALGDGSVWNSPAAVAAAISALVSIVSIQINYGINRSLDQSRRHEKVLDFTKAILAEIRNNLDWNRGIDLNQHLQDMTGTIAAATQFTPFLPRRIATKIFDELTAAIHILPTQAIDAIVSYYASQHMLQDLMEDMRSPEYGAMSQARKSAVYKDYVLLIAQTVALGQVAEAIGSKAVINIKAYWPKGYLSAAWCWAIGLPTKPPS